ncbi:MAG: penicillin acylase family protein [Anaerolineae bacterium]|nr:penicillin acylase family protein [Anaerolineae bacterium]
MSRNRKLAVAGLLTAAIAAPIAGLAYLWRRPLPIISGRLELPGLNDRVQVIRDKWGVPHIYARNETDVFCAQGFVHAQERLWHMELNRRLASGRVSEIVGDIAVGTDQLMRIIGLRRAAKNDWENASERVANVLNAYARGVNAFLEMNPKKLPLEFTLLRFTPEPWHPMDSLVWIKMMAWGQGLNWDAELLRSAILERLGPDRTAKLLGSDLSAANPVIMNQTRIPGLERLAAALRQAQDFMNVSAPIGMSNNWVVDGTKTTTGLPLLANDPHLPLQMPSLWYEAHLITPAWQAAGVTLPGVPLIVIGHNSDIAWGVTNAFVDAQDLYIEKFDAQEPTRYRVGNDWESAQVAHEELRVKGEKKPRPFDVTITRHGPVMDAWWSNPAKRMGSHGAKAPPTQGQPAEELKLALKWVGYDVSRTIEAGLGIMSASNWQEFRAALNDWTEPALSFVYADRAGNIGYQLAGKTPIRKNGKGATPVPGWTDEYAWTGHVPFDELPHTYNPPEHLVVTANNAVVGKEYQHHLSLDTMNGFRAKRILDLLSQSDTLSADDFAVIQKDVYCIPAESFQKLTRAFYYAILMHPALGKRGLTAREALDELNAWDRQLSPDSTAGALYETTLYFAMKRLFSPWLGDLTATFIGLGFHPLLHPINSAYVDRAYLIALRILENEESEWMRDESGAPATSVDILANALNDTIQWLETNVAFDMQKWQWGELHRARFQHALGAVKPLNLIFNRGPFPYGGDTSTVWQAAFVPELPIADSVAVSASWRQILDLSNWDNSRGVHPTGQSGHPASRHYDDQMPLWLAGKHHALWWSREKILEHQEGVLILE